MGTFDDRREITILESKGILIKDQPYQVVLTSRRIILTSTVDHTLRSIYFRDIQKTQSDTDDSGDPVIMVFTPSVQGEIKKVVLHFPQRNFPDAELQRAHWASEINARILPPVTVSPGVGQTSVASGSLFCSKCGKKAIEGSVFCSTCGNKILYPHPPDPAKERDDVMHNRVTTPEISTGEPEPVAQKESSFSPLDSHSRNDIPVIASRQIEEPTKRSLSGRSGTRKTVVVAALGLAAFIIIIAAFFVVIPSLFPGFNLTAPGMNSSFPPFNLTAPSPGQPVITTTLPKNPGTPVITTSPAKNPGTPAIQGTTPTPEITPVRPVFIAAPGDPAMILAAYPSLFNTGDGTGIQALLAGDIKSQYPLEDLNNELDIARSNRYSIEKIEVNNQIIEGTTTTLIVEIFWNTGGDPQTSTQNLLLVQENNQWKLNTLILHP